MDTKLTQNNLAEATTDIGFVHVINNNRNRLDTETEIALQRQVTVDGQVVTVEGVTPSMMKSILNEQIDEYNSNKEVSFETPGEKYQDPQAGTFKDGIAQLYNYVSTEPTNTYTLSFDITPAQAEIVLKDSEGITVDPEIEGTYDLADGIFTYIITANGYTTIEDTVEMIDDDVEVVETMEIAEDVSILDITVDESGSTIVVEGEDPIAAEDDGTYVLPGEGTYTVTISKTGFATIEEEVVVTEEDLGTLLEESYELKSTACDISAYAIGENTGVITGEAIAVTVPFGTDPSALIATFTLSTGASAKVGETAQVSGTTPNDFTTPVSYVVTAQDTTTTKTYVVTMTVLPE